MPGLFFNKVADGFFAEHLWTTAAVKVIIETLDQDANYVLTLKQLGGVSIWPLPCGFTKNVFFGERMGSWFFMTFNITINDIIPENFTEIPQLVRKIWRLSSLILTTFINYLDFLHFLVAKKKKKKKRSKLLMSAYNIGHQHVFTFNLL